MHPYYSPTGIKTADLETLLGTLATAYTVRFIYDGKWEVLNAEKDVIYQGSQKECLHWLALQPTA